MNPIIVIFAVFVTMIFILNASNRYKATKHSKSKRKIKLDANLFEESHLQEKQTLIFQEQTNRNNQLFQEDAQRANEQAMQDAHLHYQESNNQPPMDISSPFNF